MHTLIETLYSLAPKISELIILGETSYASSTNQSGDIQLALDIQSDLLIQKELTSLKCIRAIFSEEKEEIIQINPQGKYLVAYDPIDGSSLIAGNLSVGSIFGIYTESFEGKNLIASAYILYGPRLEIVVATQKDTPPILKRYNPISQSWGQTSSLILSSQGNLNSPGGTQKNWSTSHKEMIEGFFKQGYRLRYSGGMVPDLHQILTKGGGLFSYPATTDAPQGKLRKLFEVFPFAFIFECAGGEAINGYQRLLDLPISHSHESTQCFFGSREEIKIVKEIYRNKK
ncbi:class 1 fructose-bisphosphatase [Helicobacter cholecystus]|uniref:Fructose-1,6-bisphosphatase class 1 n=1 Tax=Helicobacter cholecystus TaxID=45498 RepID=A0A3D8IWA6_9HELI|nr:class 1 fructose-bisphosphatase [Helicobacter cholecystus]RDU69246.1 class 1 fructose-bisphosphatase [Helicobacter cholecystus]VEJ24322.1 fructose-1,6-bisphosphatase [Helicobacter cholecystus]